MKIVQFLHGNALGGMEKFCIDLANALSKRDTVMFLGDPAFRTYLDDKVMFVALDIHKSRNNLFFLQTVKKTLEDFSPDIIHVHKQKSIQIMKRLGYVTQVPFVATKHDTQVKKAFYGLDYAISISKETAKTVDAKHLYSIYNGVPYVRPKKVPMPKCFNIVAVGGLRKVKGYDRLIEAVSKLSFDFHLSIIGEGSERGRLEHLIQKLDLSTKVSLVGFKKNVNDYLNSADLQVISSYSEGFSLAMVEGVFYSSILLSTKVSGCTEILSDDLLYDIQSLTQKIEDVYAHQRVYKESFKRIKEHYKKPLTMQTCVEKHRHAYEDIIQKHREKLSLEVNYPVKVEAQGSRDKEPLVSVIIPVYNAEKYLQEAVLSMLNQTYTHIEIIIIDDGSTDTSEHIVKQIKATNVHYSKNEKNMGVSATRNRGFELAKGKYIALMDADDISLPTRIEKQVAFLENNPEFGVVSSHYESFREHVFGTKKRIRKLSTEAEKIHTSLLFINMLCCPSTMIRKEVLIKHNLHFDTSLQMAEDFDLWRRLGVVTKITNIDEVLLKYRKHKNNSIKNRTILDRDYTRVIIKSFKRLEIDIEALFDSAYRLKNIQSFLTLHAALEAILKKNSVMQVYHPDYLEHAAALLMHWMFKKHIKAFGYTLFSAYKQTRLYAVKPLDIKEYNLFLRGYYKATKMVKRLS